MQDSQQNSWNFWVVLKGEKTHSQVVHTFKSCFFIRRRSWAGAKLRASADGGMMTWPPYTTGRRITTSPTWPRTSWVPSGSVCTTTPTAGGGLCPRSVSMTERHDSSGSGRRLSRTMKARQSTASPWWMTASGGTMTAQPSRCRFSVSTVSCRKLKPWDGNGSAALKCVLCTPKSQHGSCCEVGF